MSTDIPNYHCKPDSDRTTTAGSEVDSASPCSGFGRDYEVIVTAKIQVKGYDSCDAAQNIKVSDAVKLLREAGWSVNYQTR